jgi:hypothetical protein
VLGVILFAIGASSVAMPNVSDLVAARPVVISIVLVRALAPRR